MPKRLIKRAILPFRFVCLWCFFPRSVGTRNTLIIPILRTTGASSVRVWPLEVLIALRPSSVPLLSYIFTSFDERVVCIVFLILSSARVFPRPDMATEWYACYGKRR